MTDNPEFNKRVEIALQLDPQSLVDTEKQFGFTYRQGIGELLYAMITFRPDISFPLIKLSQYSTKPALEHFQVVQGIFKYLKETKDEGIYYWRETPRTDRPLGPNPTCAPSNNYTAQNREEQVPDTIRASVDSDYANDTAHRKSLRHFYQNGWSMYIL